MTAAGDITTHLFWNANANAGDAITVNPELTLGLVYKEVDFRIQVVLGTGSDEVVNPQYYSMRLKLGCYQVDNLRSDKPATSTY